MSTGIISGNLNEYHGVPLPSAAAVFSGSPRGYAHGLMPRSEANLDFWASSIDSFVYEAHWNQFQPNPTGPLNSTKVADVLAKAAWAEQNGRNFRMRLFCGVSTPEWVRSLAGEMPWYINNQNTGAQELGGDIALWWTETYADLYYDWMVAMANQFANVEPLVEVTVSLASTIYAEPMIRQWTVAENVAAVRDLGYTVEQDIQSLKTSFDIHRDVWGVRQVASSMAFNPWSEPANLAAGTAGSIANLDVSLQLMDYMTTALGRCGVWQNNSVGNPIDVRGPRYQTFYEYMKTLRHQTYPFKHAIAFQSMTLPRMKERQAQWGTTPYLTAQMVADWGANGLEMPEGWRKAGDPNYVTDAQCAALNAQFAANTAEVLGQGGGGPVGPPPSPALVADPTDEGTFTRPNGHVTEDPADPGTYLITSGMVEDPDDPGTFIY